MTMSEQTNVVVIGGGYAGVIAANHLRTNRDAAVTLINPRPVFVERINARRVSIERNVASTKWINGSCVSPYQESLVTLTIASAGPLTFQKRRTNAGMMSS